MEGGRSSSMVSGHACWFGLCFVKVVHSCSVWVCGAVLQVELSFSAHGLAKLDLFSPSDPMIVLYEVRPDGSLIELGRTEFICESHLCAGALRRFVTHIRILLRSK